MRKSRIILVVAGRSQC